MRIKIIGDNNCARATRHLLRLGGFAVTEFLPADAVVGGPHAGYAITIDLAPATHSPDAHLRPDSPTHDSHTSGHEEAGPIRRDVSSPSFIKASADSYSFVKASAELPSSDKTLAGETSRAKGTGWGESIAEGGLGGTNISETAAGLHCAAKATADLSAMTAVNLRRAGGIHFDSVDSALEAAVLRHVTQLAAAPVILDHPGGVVHSDRELRIVLPNSGDAAADEAAAVAVEFGVLRGMLDLSSSGCAKGLADRGALADAKASFGGVGGWKRWWWPFGVALILAGLGFLRAEGAALAGRAGDGFTEGYRVTPALVVGAPVAGSVPGVMESHRLKSVPLKAALLKGVLLRSVPFESVLLRSRVLASEAAQGQFATGQEIRISDGSNFLVVDACKGQTKLFASISQTGNTQLVAGTVAKKIYVCSIHVVAAAAANVAVVEGTGSVCGTGTAGVNGFGGATAATGWNFAANGGIAVGNGDSSLGAEGTSGDNVCVFSSGSGQVSGGISYVVQ